MEKLLKRIFDTKLPHQKILVTEAHGLKFLTKWVIPLRAAIFYIA